ncbi:MAG: chemotaxis protein CheB, partial [Porticoccaceae bacterium]
MQPLNGQRIWLLGASTGGLQAVKNFLSSVPVNTELAFVYAQHIPGQQVATLLRMIESQTGWPAREPSTGHFIRLGTVTVISPQFETRVSREGWIL